VKFRETWQTSSIKCFTLVGARFSGISIRPVFFAAAKDIYLQNIEKPAFTNPNFFVSKSGIAGFNVM